MPSGFSQFVREENRASIAEADGIPTTRLTDDALVGRVPMLDMVRADRADRFFTNRADDRHSGLESRTRRCGSGGECRQRAFGVDRSTSPEHAIFDPDRRFPPARYRYGRAARYAARRCRSCRPRCPPDRYARQARARSSGRRDTKPHLLPDRSRLGIATSPFRRFDRGLIVFVRSEAGINRWRQRHVAPPSR